MCQENKIFVTYSWNDETNEKVYSFVDFLRQNGFYAECDKFKTDQETSSSFIEVMNNGLQHSKIIVILSESYKIKAEAFKGGVGKEYKVISNDIDSNKQKYILVSFDEITNESYEKIVPIMFKSHEIIDLKKDESDGFRLLFSKILDKPLIQFSKVSNDIPNIIPAIPKKFTLNDEKKNKICKGYGIKEGLCKNIIKTDKYRLCKECYIQEFKNQIINIYHAQALEIREYDTNCFTATLRYGMITSCILVGVIVSYENSFNINDLTRLNNLQNSINKSTTNKINQIHAITNGNTDNSFREIANGLDIIIYSENDLIKNMMDLSNYYNEYIKNYENNPLKNHYISMNDTNNKPIIDSVNEFIKDEEKNALLILGDYGIGKTSFCMNLTYKLINKIIKDNNSYIPILVYLRDYTKAISIDEVLTNFFINKYNINNGNMTTFKQLLKYGKILLIFDGFDEIAKRVDYDVKFRVYNEICKYAIGNTKIILTCRPNYFQDNKEYINIFKSSYLHYEPNEYNDVEFNEINICGLNNQQIHNFVLSYKKELQNKKIKINDFINIINSTHDLGDLAKRPFLLNIIIKTLPKILNDSKYKTEKIVNAANLYETYTDDWLRREDSKGKSLIKSSEKKLFCENLAFDMFVKNEYEINYKNLPVQIKEYFNSINNIKDIDYFSHDIISCSFLKSDGNSNFSFIHNSFMEFFVAKVIIYKLATTKIDNIIEINNILGQNYISTEISLFINDLFNKLILEKEHIIDLLQINFAKLSDISKYNSISILSKTDINIGEFIVSLKNSVPDINLKGIDLSYSVIKDSIIKNINFDNISFYKTKLENVEFRDCSFSNTLFQKTLAENCNFTYLDLEYTNWSYSKITNCDFGCSSIVESKFNHSKFNNCRFYDADFTNVDISDTEFDRCTGLNTVIGLPYDLIY